VALAHKVNYEIDPDAGFPKYRSGEVIVRLKDGREFTRRKHVLPDEPAPAAAIVEKFMQNTAASMPQERARELADMIANVEQLASAHTLVESMT
jgi:hypothetical protein